MKQFDKWFFPDSETHIIENMRSVSRIVDGRMAYQYSKYEDCKNYIKGYRRALDIGSHIGLWAFFIAKDFEQVDAFEPIMEHAECWFSNMSGVENSMLYQCAVGAKEGRVSMGRRVGGSTGDTEILSHFGDIPMIPIDSLMLNDVDFIKVDLEGYELNALRGAEETLKRCKPCVIVEQKGDMSMKYDGETLGAVYFLQSLRASLRAEISGDYILSWD